MCTAIKWNNFFGRTLDNIKNYNMDVVITPKKYNFKFRHINIRDKNYAIIGMAYVINDYPLYAEAVNENGLAIAGLEFPDNAHYFNKSSNKKNICVFELIPYLLRQCANVDDVKKLFKNINILNESYNKDLQLTPLHWSISDKDKSIVLESTINGINIYDNPYNVLTNNPDFGYHKLNINNYINLSATYPKNKLCPNLDLKPFSFSFGSIGLPGDYSSPSRFIKALFLINNTKDVTNDEEINHFFHMLDSISPPKGVSLNIDNYSQYTIYTSCINLNSIIYYYKTYWDNEIKAVRLFASKYTQDKLIIFKINNHKNTIKYLN